MEKIDSYKNTDFTESKVYERFSKELGSCASMVGVCTVKGIESLHPKTFRANRENLEERIADLLVVVAKAIEVFNLNEDSISLRCEVANQYLTNWLELD